jgi:hypothetical protein
VRVIDTCAGCEEGSHHVDLTKAAFSAIADLDEGILEAQMRGVHSTPDIWCVASSDFARLRITYVHHIRDLELFGPEAN